MKRALFILLFIVSTSAAFAQKEQRAISGEVVDATTGYGIENVLVSIAGERKQDVTNFNGHFRIESALEDQVELRFSHVSHRDTSFFFSFNKKSELTVKVELSPMSYQVPEAVVQAQKPDTVFGTDSLHVADFEFTAEGKMLLLTYESQQYLKSSGERDLDLYEGCRLMLIDREGKLLDTYGISSLTTELKSDFNREPYLFCRDRIYKVGISDTEKMKLLSVDETDYKKFIEPIVASLGPFWFYSNWTESFPAFDYFAIDMRDTTHHHLLNVEDELQMKMHRASYRDLKGRDKLKAFRTELETGIDKEIVGGFMAGHHQSIYHEETYAPLVVSNDTVLIFDYCSDMLYKADRQLSIADSTKIKHHEKGPQDWRRDLLQDRETQEIFAVYEKHGYIFIKLIEKSSGKAVSTFKLHHRYPQNIQVQGGKVYYTYRPFGSIQKKFLYSEKLPWEE